MDRRRFERCPAAFESGRLGVWAQIAGIVANFQPGAATGRVSRLLDRDVYGAGPRLGTTKSWQKTIREAPGEGISVMLSICPWIVHGQSDLAAGKARMVFVAGGQGPKASNKQIRCREPARQRAAFGRTAGFHRSARAILALRNLRRKY
jgi:hypothetical protein